MKLRSNTFCMPQIFTNIKKYLENATLAISITHEDGRLNSCVDEQMILSHIISHFNTEKEIIVAPKKRWWYDFKVYDDELERWFPVNIKSTTTETSDNIGNLTTIVQAYTSYNLDLNKRYNNGILTDIFKLCKREEMWNQDIYKDYYFLVIDKKEKRIIINSVLGLSIITKNKNNLPFQIKWKNNLFYHLEDENPETHIYLQIQKFLNLYRIEKVSWQEKFLEELRIN